MGRLLLSLGLQCLVVLYGFPLIDPEFGVSGGIWDALIVVLFFGFVNFLLRILLVVTTLGLGYLIYILTLGLAGLVVNALALSFVADFLPFQLYVPSFWDAFLGGALLALANYVAKNETKPKTHSVVEIDTEQRGKHK